MMAYKFDYNEHAKLVEKWPEKHNFPLPPPEFLPDVGFIVDDTACGFLYISNSKIGWVEWVYSNPEKPKEQRADALDMLFKLLEITAKELGIRVLFSASAIPAYKSILERNGFEITDKDVVHYLKVLGGSKEWQSQQVQH